MKEHRKVKIGIVKFFDNLKGFGFIREINTGEEFIVHINCLINSIKTNDEVEFEIEKTNKRMMAVRVRVL